MSTVVLVARIAIALVFVVAGVTKAFDRPGTRSALSGFGVPSTLVPLGVSALPAVEVAAAVLVLIPATAWWGGLLSLVLLCSFTVAVAVNLGKGRTPDCHCFGQLAPSTIGASTIWRNVLFAVPALVVVLFA